MHLSQIGLRGYRLNIKLSYYLPCVGRPEEGVQRVCPARHHDGGLPPADQASTHGLIPHVLSN